MSAAFMFAKLLEERENNSFSATAKSAECLIIVIAFFSYELRWETGMQPTRPKENRRFLVAACAYTDQLSAPPCLSSAWVGYHMLSGGVATMRSMNHSRRPSER
jgi:hypothetical protein